MVDIYTQLWGKYERTTEQAIKEELGEQITRLEIEENHVTETLIKAGLVFVSHDFLQTLTCITCSSSLL